MPATIAYRPRPGGSGPDPFTDDPTTAAGEWHVLYTRSRQEKALADELSMLCIAYFLPCTRQLRIHGRKKAVVETPLFPGYLFIRGAIEDAYRADRSGRVAQIIRVVDQDRMAWELQNIHMALSRQAPLEPYPAVLRRGLRVEVKSGPFSGLRGVVSEQSGLDRLILQVELLGRATSLQLDNADVEVLD